MQARQRVQNQFNRLVGRRLAKVGLSPTPVCQQLIEKMIWVGVSRLENQRALEREEQILLSEQNLLRCISELQERAKVLGTFPTISDEAFYQMQKKLSPLWPFC